MKRNKLKFALLLPLLISCGAYTTTSFPVHFIFAGAMLGEKEPAMLVMDNNTIPALVREQYNITHFVAGDVIDITYRGTILVAESYPGQLSFAEAKVKSVVKHNAGVLEVTTRRTNDTLTFVYDGDSVLDTSKLSDYYISDTNFNFAANSELNEGDVMYATYNKQESNSDAIKLLQLYAYPPYITHD